MLLASEHALLGGVLIGLSASLLLLLDGKVAGISGIVGGLVRPRPGEAAWRIAFVIGLLAGGALLTASLPSAIAPTHGGLSLKAVAVAGLLVGFGTRLGHGCTSGHGVCGLSRGSPRSAVAVITFMATGATAAYFVRHLLPRIA
ncbi:MAG: YeeE/YedE thiosulfate transporter family protein [Polyangiaceae bacterium]|jgi:uncharacterized membrane protein YedE/YeeE